VSSLCGALAGMLAVGVLQSSSAVEVGPAGAVLSSPSGLAVPPRLSASTTGLPALNTPWVSANWSGYAVTGSGITSVSGSWAVPAVSASPAPAYSATWMGIDGFSTLDRSLIQVGTEQDAPGIYDAWWSTTYYEQPIAEPVGPGDAMSAAIRQASVSTWLVSVADTTRGWRFSQLVSYSGPGQSAEWIVEAPTVNGQAATLADYSTVSFDLAKVNGGNPLLLPIDAGVMHPPGSMLLASVPSIADLDTDGFTIAYGSVPPLPPSS
jgi:hypothetical protein